MTSPAVAATTTGKTTTVYASWNGDDDVSHWEVLAGSSPNALGEVTSQPRRGFETQITIPASPYVAVLALDAGGQVMSSSTTVQAQQS